VTAVISEPLQNAPISYTVDKILHKKGKQLARRKKTTPMYLSETTTRTNKFYQFKALDKHQIYTKIK